MDPSIEKNDETAMTIAKPAYCPWDKDGSNSIVPSTPGLVGHFKFYALLDSRPEFLLLFVALGCLANK
jgi:hypothetical protein